MREPFDSILDVEGGCLLHPDAKPLLDQLAGLIEGGTKGTPRVLIRQKEAAGQPCWRVWQWLAFESLRGDCEERIQAFRDLLSRMRQSEIEFIYVSYGDILGTFWDLALSCSQIIALEQDFLVGYPILQAGGFPLGGVFESRFLTEKKKLKIWQETPVLPLRLALEQQFLTMGFSVSDPDEQLEEYLRHAPPRKALVQKRDSTGWRFSLPSRFFGRDEAKNERELWALYFNDVKDEKTPFERVLALCKDHHLEHGVREKVLVKFLGTFLFSRAYLRALAAQARDFGLNPYRGGGEGFVKIELGGTLPDTAQLARLLQRGIGICLYSPNLEVLRQGVEVVYYRLQKILASEDLAFLWRRQVVWADALVGDMVEIHSLPNFTTVISDQHVKVELQNISERALPYGSGVVEVNQPALDRVKSVPWWDYLSHLADYLIPTHYLGDLGMPLSQFLRAKVFEEVVWEMKARGLEFVAVLDELKERGFRHIDKISSWERYLNARHAAYGMEAQALALPPLTLHEGIWEISEIREIDEILGGLDLLPLPCSLEDRLTLLTGLILFTTLASGRISGFLEGELLFSESIGYPASLGTPFAQLKEWGEKRVAYLGSSWLKLAEDQLAPLLEFIKLNQFVEREGAGN